MHAMRGLSVVLLVPLCACEPTTSASPSPGVRLEPPVLSTSPTPTTGTEPYEMYGFSFVDELVAGMPQPGSRVPLETDLAFLAEHELALLVSLTVAPVDPVELAAFGMDGLHLPIEDFHPPTYDQQVALVEELLLRESAGQRVGVHCTAGYGRTGTMLATWFVANGMDAESAIAEIRRLRPGSIETSEQEQAVRDFELQWAGE